MFSMYGWMLGSRDERRFGCEPCLTSALAGLVVVVVVVVGFDCVLLCFGCIEVFLMCLIVFCCVSGLRSGAI